MKSKLLFLTELFLIAAGSSFGQVPGYVDLSTGRTNVSIPLYSYMNKSQRISLGMSLNYNSGGIKVDEIASAVGTGWSLNAGGFVRRMMIGAPDDKYPEGAMYQPGISTSDKDAFIPINSSPQVNNTYKDNELDVFEFNFNGRQGTFSIGRNKEIIQHVDSKMKVSFTEEDMTTQNILTRISKFVIVTEDGIEYTFDKKETTTRRSLIASTYTDNGHQPTLTTTSKFFPLSDAAGPKSFVSAWYLSSIKNILTGKNIQLQYSNVQTYKVTGRSETNSNIDNGNDAHNHTVTTIIDLINYPSLTKILFPDGGNITFNYETNPRLDYGTDIYDYGHTDHALSSIIIDDNGKTVKEYHFSFAYLFKNTELDYAGANALGFSMIDNNTDQDRFYLRLALKELKVSNSGKEFPSYKFFYRLYSGSSGPINSADCVPPRLSTRKNGFGFYTDKTYYHPLGNGLLQKIQYPTGGYTEFFYAENAKVSSPGIGRESNGVSVAKTVTYDGINHQNDMTTEYAYVLHDKNGNILHDAVGNPVNSIYGNYATQTVLQKSSFVETSGSPTIDELFQVLGYIYGGRSFVAAVIVNIVHKIVSFFIGSSFRTIDYEIERVDGGFNEKLPVRYSETEVVSKSSGEDMGKTIYSFTSFNDIPPLFSNQSPPYSQKQTAPDWCFGQPKSIKTYNTQGDLVREVNYTYNFIYRVLNGSWFESAKIEPFRILAVKSSNYNTYESHITWDKDYYYPITGRIELKSRDVRNFSLDGSYQENSTRYKYDPNTFHLKDQESINSVGDTISTRVYYPEDYSLPGAIQTMKDNNMYAFPLSSETWMHRVNDAPKILAGTITDYQAIGNGDIKPVKIYNLQSNQPVAENTIGSFDPSTLNRNTTYFKDDGSLIYDAQGNLIQTYSRGKTVSMLYGYGRRYIIAEVSNAANGEIAYTSFEADEKGNWQYSGVPEPVGTGVPVTITGEKYYDLSKGALTKLVQGLTSGKKYVLSYWTKNSSALQLNYSSTVTKGRTVQGWTYFQHVFAAGSSNVVLSGNGLIDEVRLFPADAQMTTISYKPMTGKTSVCDIANHLLYYQYDELGRLLFILDENRNIIQRMTYHDANF